MALCAESVTYRPPEAFTASPLGPLNSALVATPPSPENPRLPLPALVTMIPSAYTFRTRVLPSAM